jgi:hypothetical protein
MELFNIIIGVIGALSAVGTLIIALFGINFGGKIAPQFEVERFRYDPQTMDIQWKGTNKTVRYYYTDNGKTMVKSWKLK